MVEHADTLLQQTHLLRLGSLIHALPLQTTSAGLVTSGLERLSGGGGRCGGLLRLDDGVPECAEDGGREGVDLNLDFVGVL